MTAPGRGRVWSIVLRSLLVQASWSFQRMQGPGFFLMSWPAARRRHGGDATAAAGEGIRVLRHFNTHPYFAPLIAATVEREEEEGRRGSRTDELARTLASALGAVGDEFFWAHLRPLAALAALPAALAGFAWAPLVLLALYDVPHLGVRWLGAAIGLARGRGVLDALQRRHLSRTVPALAAGIAAGAGFLVAALAARPGWTLVRGSLPGSAAAAGGIFVLLAAILRRGVPPQRVLAAGVGAAVIAGAFAVVGGR